MLKGHRANLNPDSISCDFEIALFRMISNSFPNAEIMGCFFHFVKKFNKTLAVIGLTTWYNREPNFALQARVIPALAFFL